MCCDVVIFFELFTVVVSYRAQFIFFNRDLRTKKNNTKICNKSKYQKVNAIQPIKLCLANLALIL